MSKAVPWSIKGVDFDVREAAKDAARRDGVTLGEWMNRALAERAAEIGVSAQEFDADERLEAVAAQLARLSREAEEDVPPRGRAAEPARRQAPRAVARPDRERASVAPSDESDWDDDLPRERPAPRNFFARDDAEDARRSRSAREAGPSAGRRGMEFDAGEERPAPRGARVPPRTDERLDQRLADIEHRLHRDEKEAIKPLHGMIASVQDRLGDIESRLVKKDRFTDDRPLRGALERLEARIEAMSRQSEASADDSQLRQLDGRLAAILSRLEKVESSPPGAARDEQFVRLEKRFDALMARLDRPAAPSAASSAVLSAAPARRVLADAVAEIAERQRDLDSAAGRPSRPPSPQLTALLDERFEVLARKFDIAAAKTAAPAPDRTEKARIDLLQNGIQALSGRIEDMRKDFASAGADSRAALETLARDLSARVEAALAAPTNAGVAGLTDLRRDISALSRSLGDVAPRAAVSGVENAMRDLANRVDAAQAAMLRAAEARREPIPSADDKARIDLLQNGIQALSGRIEDMRKDFASAGADSRAALETLARDLSARVEAALAAPSNAGVAGLTDLRRDISALSRSLGDVAPRAVVSSVEAAMRDLAGRVDAAREAMLRAAQARPEPAASAELEALGKQVATMSRTLSELAPRSQVTSLENAVRALTARIERSRDDGMREAVLAPIESLADDVRRALAEAGASANFDGVSRQLQEVENKIEQLRQSGGPDRADLQQVYDQSEQIRAMMAQAMQKMAPIEHLERQVGELGQRLEEVARETRAASSAQVALPWGEIEARLNDLAARIDRAAFDRAPQLAAIDDSRFDDISRRLDGLHEALASRADQSSSESAAPHAALDESRFDDLSRRLDSLHEALAVRPGDAQGEWRGEPPAPTLEPLLRSLSARLDAESAPQIDAEALESLGRRIGEISQRLEGGATEAEGRLQRAIDQITERLDLVRDPEREERNAREIADLREKTELSDRRAQQTLSAVHETLEKVVDRLAMIEEDVIEARGAAEAAARAPAAPPLESRPRPVVAADDFLMEPGAGHPGGRRDPRSLFSDEDFDEAEDDVSVPDARIRDEDEEPREGRPAQATYIDVARRALAARLAAEAAEKLDNRKPDSKETPCVAAVAAEESPARFVRPMSSGRKSSARMPALLFTAVSVLSIGAYQAYRLFDGPTPPMQLVPEPHADKAQGAPAADAAQAPARQADSPAQAAPAPGGPAAAPAAPAGSPGQSSSLAPVPAPTAMLHSAPIVPSSVLAPKASLNAGLPDPLATGAIGARPNTLSAIQAGAQALAVKELAAKGDAAAQFDYAARLVEGRGIGQDKVAAIGWFEKAAAQGLAQAQYRLGAIYEKGLGLPRDPVKARDYYEKAANQGNVRAMHNLAVILAEGVDGKPDYSAAATWFRRAADYGVRDSQFNLAILYARGMGVPQNLGQSYVWFAAAALQGDEDAAKKRDEVGAQLDATAREAARKQVAEFHARTPASAVNEPPTVVPGPGASASAVSAAVGKALSKL